MTPDYAQWHDTQMKENPTEQKFADNYLEHVSKQQIVEVCDDKSGCYREFKFGDAKQAGVGDVMRGRGTISNKRASVVIGIPQSRNHAREVS
jgi:hypothetical protein